MSKTLFYAGLISCALVAMLLVAMPGQLTLWQGSFPRDIGSDGPAPLIPIYLLVLTLPVAAIFVRMASLLAARNLFSSFLAGLAAFFSAVTASLLCAVQLRIDFLRSATTSSGDSLIPLAEMKALLLYLLAWALSVMFMVLRPYFRFQASPILSAFVYLPLPLFLCALYQEFALASSGWASLAFRGVIALLFLATAFHCLRHRHLFIEVTNLRELLDARVDPSHRGRRLPLRGGVAFDS